MNNSRFLNCWNALWKHLGQQWKSSSPPCSPLREALSTVMLSACKWKEEHSSLISNTGFLTSWPHHFSVGLWGFEIICGAFCCRIVAVSVSRMTKLTVYVEFLDHDSQFIHFFFSVQRSPFYHLSCRPFGENPKLWCSHIVIAHILKLLNTTSCV